jgi:anti-sigma-K factor RskA
MSHDEFEAIAALDALGAATMSEAGALRLHLAGCIPCRAARGEFAEATTLIASSLAPVEPPRSVRAQIREALAPADTGRRSLWWLATAATLLVAVWGLRELRFANARAASQAAQVEKLQRDNARLSSEIAALASAETRTIALAGQEVAPAASAKVFLEPDRRRAIVFFHDLPANPGDKSYQLWIIRADEPRPLSAGIFDVSKSGAASITIENLPVSTEIQALAVTLEPRGGAEQPTNTAFYVAGKT